MQSTWREELAWAAGFFDGEGCTATNGMVVQLNIGQTNIEELYRFQRAVGGVGYIPKNPIRKQGISVLPQWYFHASAFADVQAMMAQLWPFLGEPKKAQYKSALRKAKIRYLERRRLRVLLGERVLRQHGNQKRKIRLADGL